MTFRPLFAVLVLLVAGCAGFREAFDERVLHKATGEPESISLGCGRAFESEKQARPQVHGGVIGLGEITDNRPYKGYIGGMFDRPSIPLPVSTGGATAVVPFPLEKRSINLRLDGRIEDIVSSDVIKALELASYAVIKGPDGKLAPPVSLNVEIQDAWVESYPAGWSESAGELKGGIAFKLTLIDNRTRQVVLTREIYGGEETRIAYSLKRYHEETLKKAYCKAIASVVEAVNADFFRDAVQGKKEGPADAVGDKRPVER